MKKNTVALMLSSDRPKPDTVTYAISRAKKTKATLVVMLVREAAHIGFVESILDIGLISEKSAKQMERSAVNDLLNESRKNLDAISFQAVLAGVKCEVLVKSGSPAKEGIELIKKANAELVIVARSFGLFLFGPLFGYKLNKLIKNSPVPVVVA